MSAWNEIVFKFVGSHATTIPENGSSLDDYYTQKKDVTITIKPDPGYIFNNTVGTYYESNSKTPNYNPTNFTATTPNSYTLVIPSSYLTRILNSEKTFVNVDITPVEGVANSNMYSQTLTHCTSNYSDPTLPTGQTVITYTADDGYQFEQAGSCTVTNTSDGTTQKIPLNLVDSSTQTLTLNLSEPTVSSKYEVTLSATQIPLGKTILKLNLTNCKCIGDTDGEIVTDGSNSFSLVTNDKSYLFRTAGTIVLTNSDTQEVVSTNSVTLDSSHQAHADFTLKQNANNYTLTITQTAEINAPKTFNATVKLALQNCSSDTPDGTLIPSGSKKVITLTADDGYQFTKNGVLTIDSGIYQAPYDKEFPLTGTKTTQVTIDATNMSYDMTYTIKLSANLPSNLVGNFSNLYLTNNIELGKLSLERIYTPSSGSDARSVYKLFDYGSFINNLISIPFDIPDSYKEPEKIILGDKTTDIDSTGLTNNILPVNIGTITIKPKYNNALDYLNAKAYIYLPFLNRIPIDVSYLIGHKISIQYIIDLYSGQATININDESNNIYTAIEQLGSSLPFIQLTNDRTTNSQKMTILNNIRQAYIMILRNKPLTNSHYPTLETDTINKYNGYIKVSSVDINDDIDSDEKQKIANLLENGVIIK